MSTPPPPADATSPPSEKPPGEHPSGHGTPRRSFVIEACAIACGAAVGVAPVVAGLAFYVDPLTRRPEGAGSADGFYKVGMLSELPADGTPVRLVVQADKIDAWNVFKNQIVGTVYLRRIANEQVLAFNDTCPHLGCKVDYKPADQNFFCPCHLSAFSLEGEKTNKIPPRGLDTLETRVQADGSVWVKYMDFRGGTEQKIPIV